MKYFVRKEIEYKCIIYSVINSLTDCRVNYFASYEAALKFAESLNLESQICKKVKDNNLKNLAS